MSKIRTIEELVDVLRSTGILPKTEDMEDWVGGSLKGEISTLTLRVDSLSREMKRLDVIREIIERLEMLEARKVIEVEEEKDINEGVIREVLANVGGKMRQKDLVDKLLDMRSDGKWYGGRNKTEKIIKRMCDVGDVIKRERMPDSRYEYIVELI